MAREQKIPGPDHPITVQAEGTHVVARVGDTVIAETRDALTLREANYPPAYYVPLADVDPAVLRPSDTTTYCPYKGEASYYSVETPSGGVTDAMWFYPQPYDAVGGIVDHVAFYTDRLDVVADA
ncbi:DUF427 domain-containing protein [Jatrophihabitans endophyticus]|uniref:DUF427 domain-containing protein n=1 Tax=Jatrophihabitans endophyticus TaxID=1206085 RepID=UPI0019FC4397|nr:DUF427 domain-containing protein [Jatrophihabitans endophyticus]MBE7188277.1 DUF427 domain-containing protein [Jatrophihabitans endophyticus]